MKERKGPKRLKEGEEKGDGDKKRKWEEIERAETIEELDIWKEMKYLWRAVDRDKKLN